MRVEELSVGDYIRFNGSPYIVEEISGKGWIHILDADTKARVQLSSDYILDFIDGVPLTPEILEKNGMHLYNRKTNNLMEECRHSDIFEEDENYRVELSLDYDGSIRWTINGDEYTIMPLDYVHQLQQALRLCGIAREIII